MNIDQVMLGNMSSSEEVGNYAAAVKFSEVWYFIPTVVCSSVFPAIIQAKQQIEQEHSWANRVQHLLEGTEAILKDKN